MKIEWKYKTFHSCKSIRKCDMRKWSSFCLAGDELTFLHTNTPKNVEIHFEGKQQHPYFTKSISVGRRQGINSNGIRSVQFILWAFRQIRKIAGAHAPGMPGTFSPPPRVRDPDMHHGSWCMPGSLTSGFLWNRRRGKTFPAFPAHAQPAILRIW